MVETKFNKKIKVFQSDGGEEFFSNDLKQHFIACEIQYFLSCPYNLQQNGISERNHRHVMELGLAMMFHSYTPLQCWVEVFFSANYLINGFPSFVLDLRSPSEVLVGLPPTYTALRTFGSACYPYLRPYATHKFDPRSLQCIFIGYLNRSYLCVFCF